MREEGSHDIFSQKCCPGFNKHAPCIWIQAGACVSTSLPHLLKPFTPQPDSSHSCTLGFLDVPPLSHHVFPPASTPLAAPLCPPAPALTPHPPSHSPFPSENPGSDSFGSCFFQTPSHLRAQCVPSSCRQPHCCRLALRACGGQVGQNPSPACTWRGSPSCSLCFRSRTEPSKVRRQKQVEVFGLKRNLLLVFSPFSRKILVLALKVLICKRYNHLC